METPKTPLVDRIQVDKTARQLCSEYGVQALEKANERIIRANSEDRSNEAEF